jgi:hypothetical protein
VRLSAHGIEVDLPTGWEGRIYKRPGGDPTLHAANFALPANDGDFGSSATAKMPRGGSFVVLTEYRPGEGLEPGRGLFAAEDIPLPLDLRRFDPRTLHIGRKGQAGFQHFFTSRGRPFCLYAVIDTGTAAGGFKASASAATAAKRQVSGINSVLGTVAISKHG